MSLYIWCSAVQSVVGATHLYTIYILSTHYLHCYHQSIVTIYLMSEEGSDPSCCLGCVHNITGLLQFLLKIGEEQLTIQISFLITIHYLHTIYTLSKHNLFLICLLSTQSQYLVQSAVVYWVQTYLHTIYTLSIHYLHTIYTVSVSGAVSAGVLGADSVTRLLGESIAGGQSGNTRVLTILSYPATSNQQPTPERLSGSSGCSSWCRSRGKHTCIILVF